jgi:hypothetical protein
MRIDYIEYPYHFSRGQDIGQRGKLYQVGKQNAYRWVVICDDFFTAFPGLRFLAAGCSLIVLPSGPALPVASDKPNSFERQSNTVEQKQLKIPLKVQYIENDDQSLREMIGVVDIRLQKTTGDE